MDRAIVEELVRAAREAHEFISMAQGTCLGVAMSGKDHPNPDEALMNVFRRGTEFESQVRAAILAAERELSKDQSGRKYARPEGWTDQRAMEFVGAKYSEHDALSVERIAFMKHFLKGEWAVVNKYFPEFQQWLDKKGGK